MFESPKRHRSFPKLLYGTGRVGYRRVVPAPLRPLVGKSEIERTLGVRLLPGAKELPAMALPRTVEIDREPTAC